MDKIFKNGNILTMEPGAPRAEALAVQFGRIYKIGPSQDIEALATPQTQIIDLKGQRFCQALLILITTSAFMPYLPIKQTAALLLGVSKGMMLFLL